MALRYVHFAEAHAWSIADSILAAGAELLQPERRIVAQLGARSVVPWQARGKENDGVGKRAERRLNLVGAAGIEPATYSV